MSEFTFSRRTLLKAGLAGVSSITLGGSILLPVVPGRAGEAGEYVSLKTGRVLQGKPTVCGLCPAGCGILAFTDAGVPEGLAGNPGHPYNRGAICALGSSAMTLINAPGRILNPVRRKGGRGEGKWEPISWEQALSEIKESLNRDQAGAGRGPLAVSVPEKRLSPFLERFVSFFPDAVLEASDGYELAVERAVHGVLPGGASRGEADLENAQLVLNFGANPLGSVRQVLGAGRGWAKGRDEGARWITLDPRLSETAAGSRQWVPLRPGTDGVFAWALANLLVQAGTFDAALGKTLDPSHEKLLASLRPWSPERAAKICGVSAQTIRDIAGEFARTERAVAIFGSGVTARKNGERDARGVMLLNVLKGNIDKPGGYRLAGGHCWRQPAPRTGLPDVSASSGTLFRDVGQGARKVGTLITLDANPAVTDPDCGGTVEVLKDTGKVPFHVAFSSQWNETANLADIVLPASLYLEEWGLSEGFSPSGGSSWVGLRQPVFPGRGEARAPEDVLLGMVREGTERGRQAFPFKNMETYYRVVLETSLARSMPEHGTASAYKQGFVALPGTSSAEGEDPAGGQGLLSGKALAQARQDLLPKLSEVSSGGRDDPDPAAAGGENGKGGPAHREKTLLLFGSPMQGPDAPRCPWIEEIDHCRPLWMHPSAAREIGCREGDWVSVKGPAGEIRTRVRLTQGLHPEAVAMAGTGQTDSKAGTFREGADAGPGRVWWQGEVYGENVRKIIPWPQDPGQEAPGWEDTRVTILRSAS